MSTTVIRQQDEVIRDLLKERFPDLNGVRVTHPSGLVPVVLAQHLGLAESPDLGTDQMKALGDAAALLDAAQQKAREIRFLDADSLSGWHRLAQHRRLKSVSVAGRLVEAFEIAKQAGIVLYISTGLVNDREISDGGKVRCVLIDAAPVRQVHPTPSIQARSTGAASSRAYLPGEGSGILDLAREATLIAAGYIARHPDAEAELPAIIREISGALQSCGTLPIDIDDVPHFADRLAKAMPSAPRRLARHPKVRRQLLDRRVRAGT